MSLHPLPLLTWVNVHIFAAAMGFFGLLGIAGLYARQAEKSGWLGLAGFLLFQPMAGAYDTLYLCGSLHPATPGRVIRRHLWPASWGCLPALPALSTWGSSQPCGIYRGPLYILGTLLFGIATFRAGVLPRWAGRVAYSWSLAGSCRCSGST